MSGAFLSISASRRSLPPFSHRLSDVSRLSRKSPVPPKKEEDKKPHIKKPLNAFMLYMKEMRAKVVAECTLKESAAINQILGRRVSGARSPECARARAFSARSCLFLDPLSPSTVAFPVKRGAG